jgi:hypothetical protein
MSFLIARAIAGGMFWSLRAGAAQMAADKKWQVFKKTKLFRFVNRCHSLPHGRRLPPSNLINV